MGIKKSGRKDSWTLATLGREGLFLLVTPVLQSRDQACFLRVSWDWLVRTLWGPKIKGREEVSQFCSWDMEVVAHDSSKALARGSYFNLFMHGFSLSAAKAWKPKWEQGLWLLYADGVLEDSLGAEGSNNVGQEIILIHCRQEENSVEAGRHLLVSSFLLVRARFMIPPVDFSFWQTKYCTVFSVIQFCLGPGDLSLPNAQSLGHAVLLSGQTDFWEIYARVWDQLSLRSTMCRGAVCLV